MTTVVGKLREWLHDRDGVRAFLDGYVAEWREAASHARREQAEVTRKLHECKAGLDRLIEALASGRIPLDLVEPKVAALTAEREALEQRLAMVDAEIPKVTPHPEIVQRYWRMMNDLNGLGESLETIVGTEPELPGEFQKLIGRVTVLPGDPANIKVEDYIEALLGDRKDKQTKRLLGVVAGEGVEPPTPGL